jgi:hypothetical protein
MLGLYIYCNQIHRNVKGLNSGVDWFTIVNSKWVIREFFQACIKLSKYGTQQLKKF